MLNPQFILPIASELVVDLFAGGGGASTGIEQALGRHVDIAVNHDPEAVSLHQANHPQTKHFISDVFEVDPLAVTGGQRIGLLWASPDCTFHSKARGGKPFRDRNKARRRRGLATVVTKWVRKLKPTGQHPRVIVLENVEEFQHWGPLLHDGTPCPERRGTSFARWVAQLRNMDYQVEHRELRACDFGAPTIRKRLFLVARCDGMPIVWPQPTHAAKPAKGSSLKPYRTAADCIDWALPCPSIFERDRPLAEATMRRIAHGLKRYVIDADKPYIVRIGHTGQGDGGKAHGIDAPLSTITSKAEHLLASPTLVQTGYGERPGQAPRVPGLDKPLGTCVDGQKHALVAAFVAKHFGGQPQPGKTAAPMHAPAPTVLAKGGPQGLVTANLVHMGHGEQSADGARRWSYGIRDVQHPLNTITASGVPAGIVTSQLAKLRGTSNSGGVDQPIATISAQGTHHAEVRALLLKYYGTDQDPQLAEPLHTVTTKDRFGLVTVQGQDYFIADIGMRMLQPHELYRAQGFPDSYVIDRGADGRVLSKAAQVRMCGNSVCPPLSRALVMANYSEGHALIKEAA